MPAAERHLEGIVIAGNFRIERQLGRGAMGEVYLAEQISLGKKIAIKVLHRHLQGDEGLARRFHREAKAASSLNHPNSLQIIDFGQSDSGELFIAMEFLQGRDLSKLMQSEFPLSLERIVRVMSQVLSALDEAHAINIIHRDLKPENIMIVDRRGERDHVKVCDFGIAKIQDPKSDGGSGSITMAGVVCGTPEYMSPEQCRGERLDGRSDLYAVGVILYQMVTGSVPFTAETALGIVTKHLTEPPEPPRKRRPDVQIDPGLEAIILQAMEKDRERRPASAFVLKEQLECLLRGRSGTMPLPVSLSPERSGAIASAPVASAPPPADEGVEAELAAVRGGRWPLIALVSVLLLGAIGIGVLRARQSPAQIPIATAPPSVVAAPPPTPAPTPPVAAPPVVEVPAPPPVDPTAKRAERPPREKRVAKKRVEPSPRPAVVAAPPSVEPPKAPALRPAEAAYKEGNALFDQGRHREAVARYLDSVRADGNFAPSYKALGRVYTRLQNFEDAKRYYRRYLELNPNDAFVPTILKQLEGGGR